MTEDALIKQSLELKVIEVIELLFKENTKNYSMEKLFIRRESVDVHIIKNADVSGIPGSIFNACLQAKEECHTDNDIIM